MRHQVTIRRRGARWLWGALLFLGLVLHGSQASAEDAAVGAVSGDAVSGDAAVTEGAPGSGVEGGSGGDVGAVVPSGPVLEMPLSESVTPGLRPLWRRFVENFDANRTAEALIELEKLEHARVDAGFRNLPSVSLTLVLIARELLERSPPDTGLALQLLESSRAISPDIPELHGETSRVLLMTETGSITEALHGYFRQFLSSLEYLPSSYGVVLGGVSALWVTGLILMLFFTLAMVVRYVKLFGHDLVHLVHVRLHPFQTRVLGLIILASPLILGLGIVSAAVLCWVLLWLYMHKTERILAAVLLLFVAMWPVMQRATVDIVRGVDGPEASVFRCFYEECTATDVERLQAEATASQPSPDAGYMVALSKYRSAWADAELLPGRHNWLATLIANSESDDPRLQLLLGNIATQIAVNRCVRAKGDVEAGKEYFEEAKKLYSDVMVEMPSMWEAHFNMAKLLSVMNQPTEAQQYLRTASEHNRAAVAEKGAWSRVEGTGCQEGFAYNRELAVPAPDLALMAGRSLSGRFDRLPVAHELLLGPLPPAMCYGLGLAGVFLWLLQTLLIGFIRPSSRCVKCGGVRCSRCREELAIITLCDECLQYKMRGQFVDPKEIWYRDQAIEAKKRWRRRLDIFFGVLVPGAGQFFQGRPLRGLLFMGGIALILSLVFLSPAVIEIASTPRVPSAGNVLGAVVGSALAGALYLWSLLDFFS